MHIKLTNDGYSFAKSKKNSSDLYVFPNVNNLYEPVQILLSNVFVGYFLIPDDHIWNYNLMGIKFNNNQNMHHILIYHNHFMQIYIDQITFSNFLCLTKETQMKLTSKHPLYDKSVMKCLIAYVLEFWNSFYHYLLFYFCYSFFG
nr:pre-mRNA-processing-splicing factor 8,putative [Plasmodium sp. DRC-Itaito]